MVKRYDNRHFAQHWHLKLIEISEAWQLLNGNSPNVNGNVGEVVLKYRVTTKEATNICFDLKVVDNKLIFRTENQVFKQNEPTRKEEGGIGLRNTRKRLDFLYPNKHQFATRSKNGTFVAELEVELG